MSKPPLYTTWTSMKSRCYNKNNMAYKYYGGRGIKVCTRWRESFADFFEDMGPKPSKKYTIDRVNNDGNYEPGNCRWATRKQQGRNTRRYRGGRDDNLSMRLPTKLKREMKREAKRQKISLADLVTQIMVKAV